MKHWLRAMLVLGLALAGVTYGQSTNRWEKSASAGLSVTKGNSDTLLFTADVIALRKWTNDEMRLGASASYGEDDGEKNNETVRGFAQWNHLFTERFYSYVRLDALHDAIADVDYRVSLSPGAGYYFIKNDITKLSGEVGPGVVFEKQGGEESQYFTIRLAERFEHKFNDHTKLWQSLEFLPQIDDFDNFIINAEIGVEAALTKKLSLRVYAQDTYDNEPAPGHEENDFKLVSAIALKF
jgi:putative salt-induced outer membrane protein